MKKIILYVLLVTITIPVLVFAKNPKETVEYWKNKPIKESRAEYKSEMDKCWNKSHTFFKVPVGSEQWNICCAIIAAYDGSGRSFEKVSDDMVKTKQSYME